MSDEKKEVKADETDLNIPVLNISEEEIEKNKQNMENAKKILTPPDGQVLAGLRSFCPVHGDITRASKILKHTLYMRNEKTGKVEAQSFSDVICLACLSELWRNKVVANYPKDENGNPGEIKVAPVFISKEEYEKILEEQKEASEKESATENNETVETTAPIETQENTTTEE